jgi:sterol desaturase/sphingolipid hydroxylase (fatty acid hydroxylase superfamily)
MQNLADLFQSVVDLIARGQGQYLLLGVFLSGLVSEIGIYAILKRKWTKGDAWPNLKSSLVGLLINIGVGAIFTAVYVSVYENGRILTAPSNWIGWIYALVLFELVHYIEHRVNHRTGFYWAIHSVHHSSYEMNILVANRIAWGVALYFPLTMIGIPLLGVSPVQFAVVNILTTAWGIFQHTTLVPRLGVLDHLFMTPTNHRVHHGRQLKYLDCNYAQFVLLFDKIFKTHTLMEEEPDYGLVKQLDDRGTVAFQTAGFRELARKMRGAEWPDKLRYLYKPPGWTHTGKVDLTTAGLRAAEQAGNDVVSNDAMERALHDEIDAGCSNTRRQVACSRKLHEQTSSA